jgi:hypothetical protein
MIEALFLLFSFLKSGLKNQTERALKNLALRQQLAILKRERHHVRLRRRDRIFWDCLSSVWQRWRESLIVVKPETVVRWHRKGFAFYWTHLYRTHLSLAKDAPEPRAIQELGLGEVVEIPEVGGLHHHYERRAA